MKVSSKLANECTYHTLGQACPHAKLLSYVWNKEILPQQWKESISEKYYNNNYQGISISCIQHFIQHSSLNVKMLNNRNHLSWKCPAPISLNSGFSWN
jgi:hypothetical protein